MLQRRSQVSRRGLDPAPAVNGSVGCAVVVHIEIKPESVDDFLKSMEAGVDKVRSKEFDPGCMRFDVLRDRADPNKFVFYEAYVDDAAFAFHLNTSHFKAFEAFFAGGVVAGFTATQYETTSLPPWAFQTSSSGEQPSSSAKLTSVEIKSECTEEFLEVMKDDVLKCRDPADDGCRRFDLLRHRQDPNKFVFYEVYEDDEAATAHKPQAHGGGGGGGGGGGHKSWADFKERCVVEEGVDKVDTASIPGTWAFQG